MIFCTRKTSRQGVKSRRPGWVPLVLRWRRRESRRPITKMGRVTSSVSLSYFPQIHLHFTTQLNTQNQRWSVARATVYRERVLLERRLDTRIYADKTQTPLNEHRPLRINYISSSKHSALIRQIQQSRTSASVLSVFQMRQSTRREELVKIFRTQRHLREHQSQVLSFHTAQHLSSHSAQRETFVKSTHIYFDRAAEELVWRRNQARTILNEDTAIAHNTEISQRPTVRTPAVTTHAQSVAASNNQITPQQITKFDSSLLDRLTDDVIRRVEKRALVERQRRGL